MNLRSRLNQPRSGSRGDVAPETRRSLFFNRLWIVGSGVILLIGVATSEQALSLLGLFVLLTAGIGALWNRWSLVGVEYSRTLSTDRAFPDDIVVLTITVVNRKPLPLPWLTIEDELAETLKPTDREMMLSGTSGRRLLQIVTNVRPFERVTWRIPIACTTRGLHSIGPVTLRATDPFGFFTNRQIREVTDVMLVFPRLADVGAIGFPPRLSLGDSRVARNLLTDPSRVVGVRDYRPDDPFRTVHWKATARQGSLQVRIAEPTTTLQLAIFLNLDTFAHYWEGLDIATAERMIEIAAALATWADDQRYAIGMAANGIVAGSDQALRIAPGRGPAQLPRILEGLAKISPFSTMPFDRILQTGTARIAWGSTIAVITCLLSEPLSAHLANLIARGHRVVLVVVGDEAVVPPMRGLTVRRVAGVRQEASDSKTVNA